MTVSQSLSKDRNAVFVCCDTYSYSITSSIMSRTKNKEESIQTIDKNRLLLKLNFAFILRHTVMGFVVRYLAKHEVPFLACCDCLRISQRP